MPKTIRRIGIYTHSPEEISNRLFAGAQNYMREVGGFLARDYCQKESEKPSSNQRPPWQGEVDGVMICSGRDPGKSDQDMADWVLRGGVPAVVTGADWDDRRIPRFHVDSASLATLAAEHLVECGCQTFLYVGYSESAGSPKRGAAFREALARHGRELTECALGYKCLGTADDLAPLKAQTALISHLGRLKKPLGIWTLNDRFAAAVCRLCRALDLAIPQSVKVLGVDDVSLARTQQLSISSIRTPTELVAYAAMRALDRLIQRRSVRRSPTGIPVSELSIRTSTSRKTPTPVSIADCRDFIVRHACNGVTVEGLAQSVGLSTRAFELQFRKVVGCSPREEIQRVRLARAEELLQETLFSISRIGSMVGFAETAAFSKFFRKETGVSPRDFRESASGERSRKDRSR